MASIDLALVEHAAQIAVADLVAGDRDLDADGLRGGMAAGDIDRDVAQRLAGHLLGGVDGGQDRGLGRLDVDDGPAAHAARELMADADDLRPSVLAAPGDEAADLGGADIEGGRQIRRRCVESCSSRMMPFAFPLRCSLPGCAAAARPPGQAGPPDGRAGAGR